MATFQMRYGFLIMLAGAVLILSGCGKSQAQKDLDAKQAQEKVQAEARAKAIAEERAKDEAVKAKLIAALKGLLKDPDSLQLRNVQVNQHALTRNSGDWASAICGEYNAKNSFGGYGGFTKFAVIQFPNEQPSVYSGDDSILGPVAVTMAKSIGCD